MKLSLFPYAISALLIAGATSSSALAQAKPKAQHFMPDVKIDQCFVTQPKRFSKKASGTQIVYENVGTRTYSSVTFLVGYRNSGEEFLRKVVDEGQFAPGAKINHHFSLFNDITFGGKATTLCGAIAARH